MSDDNHTPKGSRPDGKRAQTIDLEKSAVTDVTPEAMEKTSEAKPAQAGDPKAEDVRVTSTAAPVAEKQKSATLPVFGGAIAGALFGLLGAVVYQNIQKPPVTVADPRVAEVEAAIAAVERKAVDAGQIEQRIKTQLAELQTRSADIERKAADVAQRAAALETKANAIEQKAQAAEQKAALVDQRAATFEQKASTIVQPVEERLKATEARLVEAREQAGALAKRVDLLAQIEVPKVDLKPIVGKVEELERAITSNSARVTLNGETTLAMDGRIKSVEQGLTGLSGALKAVDNGMTELKARKPLDPVGSVLAIAGLAQRALDAGEPVAPLATAMIALGVPEAKVQPLTAFGQTAPPRVPQLADLYADLAAKLPKPAASAPSAPPSAGIVDLLTSGLMSQVEVRKVGPQATVDATGLSTQIRQKLLGGDLGGALDLAKTLPAEQQAGLKPFIEAVQARMAAAAALKTIELDALAATTRKG